MKMKKFIGAAAAMAVAVVMAFFIKERSAKERLLEE